MRAVVCTWLAFLFSIGHSQAVSFESSGTSLTKLVAVVAEKTGKKLAVHRDLANEIVVVSVRETDFETLRKKLADCVSGKWVETDDGILELRADAAVSTDRRKEAQKELARAIPARLKATREMRARSFNTRPENSGARATQILLDILDSMPQSVFEDVLPMSSVVLSTTPFSGQRRLGDISEVIQKYLPDADLKEVKISISRSSHMPYLNSAIWIVETNGVFHQSTIGLIEVATPREKQPGKEIVWSAASQELARNYRTWDYRAEAGLLTLSQELRDVLSKPTQVDPMSFGFGEGMLAVAIDRGVNLIACAADDDIQTYLGYGVPGTTTGDFMASIKRTASLVATEVDEWIIVRPKDPVVARELRGDRVALEKLIAKSRGKTWASLDDLVEFACSNIKCPAIPGSFVLPFQSLVNYYGVTGEQYVNGDLRPLQFYGTLGVSQREKLRNGEELLISQIPPKAKEVLQMLFYQPQQGFPGPVRVEPTSVLPNGFTTTLLLKATVLQSPLIYPLPDGGEPTMPAKGKSLQKLAQERWGRKYEDNPYARAIPELSRFLVGSRALWEFHVIEGNQIYVTMYVADDRIPSSAKPTMMEQMPESLRNQMDRAYEDYLKAMGGGGISRH